MIPKAVLLVAACLATASGLLLRRPTQDCLNPPITEFTTFNFYPSDFQISSILPVTVSQDKLSTQVTIANDFYIRYYGPYKIVGNKRDNETYVLYQCGTPNPADLAPGTIPGVDVAADKVFQIPLTSVAINDTTVNGFLSELGVLDRVAYASSYSINPCLQKLANTCGNNETAGVPADVDAYLTFAADPKNKKSIAFTATADAGPLGRAEWVKFVAAFFNKELEANQVFANISASYNATKEAVAAKAGANRPVVAWLGASTAEMGAWGWGPADSIVVKVSGAPYAKAYTQDAGGQFADASGLKAKYPAVIGVSPYSADDLVINGSANAADAKAALLDFLQQADIVIDQSYYSALNAGTSDFLAMYGLTAADAAAIPALTNGKVFLPNGIVGATGSDIFEGAVARADLALADLARIVAPSAVAPSNAPSYLMPIDSNANTAPFKLTAASCPELSCTERANATAICPTAVRGCDGSLTHANPTDRCSAPVCTSATPSKQDTGNGAAAAGAGLMAAAGAALAGLLLL